jgi:hypothetical protein
MGLSTVNIKPTKKELNHLFELSRLEDPYEFVEEFAQLYNSACEMWMNEIQQKELQALFYSKKYKFKCLSGIDKDGYSDSKIDRAMEKGWTMFADEQNGDSYDSIFYKEK